MSEQQNAPPAPDNTAAEAETAGAAGAAPRIERRVGRSAWLGNLKLRALSGIPALLLVLVLIGLAPTWVVALVATAAAVYGMYEFHGLLPKERRTAPGREALLVGAALIGIGGLLGGLPGVALALFLSVTAAAVLVWLPEEGISDEAVPQAGVTSLGLLMIPWSIVHLGLIHGLPGGAGLLALLVMVISLNDTLAYVVGSLFGTHPLMPSVSPNKTVEGALAGIAGGVLGGFFMWIWLLSFTPAPGLRESLLLGAMLAALAQAGDLLESKLKRLAGVSESGTLLPGHGGLLDRVDGYLLSAPMLYYYMALTAGTAG